jgi:osmotically-inducible protein OsmY
MLSESQKNGRETIAIIHPPKPGIGVLLESRFEDGSPGTPGPVCSSEPDQSSDLRESVVHALATRNCRSLREVTIAVEGGRVLLYGTVSTYYAKQLAQQTVFSVPGVTKVVNELVVN